MAFSGGPINAILFLCSNSGNLGFSEACPQPAHTACEKSERQMKIRRLICKITRARASDKVDKSPELEYEEQGQR